MLARTIGQGIAADEGQDGLGSKGLPSTGAVTHGRKNRRGSVSQRPRADALRVLPVAQYRLDIDHGRAVDRFDRADAQPVPPNRTYDHGMQAERIRSVWRSRREHTRQPSAWIRSWMHLQDVAARAM